MEYEVTWTARYTSRITLLPGQTLEDGIENINIPEDGVSAYSCGTFEVEQVRDGEEKNVPKSRWDKIVGVEVQDE